MNANLHPAIARALAPMAPPQSSIHKAGPTLAELQAENTALRRELQIAVDQCCNQYWMDGHLARVQRLYGIEDKGGDYQPTEAEKRVFATATLKYENASPDELIPVFLRGAL